MKSSAKFIIPLLVLGGTGVPALADCAPPKSGGRAAAPYVIEGPEVRDTRTQLVWQRCSLGQAWRDNEGCVGAAKTFTSAEAFAQAAGEWRLPSQEELDSLITPGCSKPVVDTEVFPNMNLSALGYWTNTIDRGERVWYINFADGSFRRYKGSLLLMAVRLVRNAPTPR